MSGGRFDYIDSRLKGEMFGWSDEPYNVLEDREISELVWDVLDLIHDYDWYVCGDTSRKTYLDKKSAFKNKWLSNRNIRVQNIIDTAINDLKTELYETFGLEEVPKSDV